MKVEQQPPPDQLAESQAEEESSEIEAENEPKEQPALSVEKARAVEGDLSKDRKSKFAKKAAVVLMAVTVAIAGMYKGILNKFKPDPTPGNEPTISEPGEVGPTAEEQGLYDSEEFPREQINITEIIKETLTMIKNDYGELTDASISEIKKATNQGYIYYAGTAEDYPDLHLSNEGGQEIVLDVEKIERFVPSIEESQDNEDNIINRISPNVMSYFSQQEVENALEDISDLPIKFQEEFINQLEYYSDPDKIDDVRELGGINWILETAIKSQAEIIKAINSVHDDEEFKPERDYDNLDLDESRRKVENFQDEHEN